MTLLYKPSFVRNLLVSIILKKNIGESMTGWHLIKINQATLNIIIIVVVVVLIFTKEYQSYFD